LQHSSSFKENKFIQLLPISEESIIYHHFFQGLNADFIEAPILNVSYNLSNEYNSQAIRESMIMAAFCSNKNAFESIKNLFYAIVPENQIILTSKLFFLNAFLLREK
jgi:hypothetical protein